MTNNITIIIPTLNEAGNMGNLMGYLQKHKSAFVKDIIVSDGGSNDETISIAKKMGAIAVVSPKKGRSAQMNYGASLATGGILYFIHADTFPPQSFAVDILQAVDKGFDCGRYRTRFNSKKWILKINAFFTRFDWSICYGGDQTFFITKKLFNELGGYNSQMQIMEEYDLAKRAKQVTRYKIFKKATLVSARKYDGRSWWQVQMANRKAVQLFKRGASQQQIMETYSRMLKNPQQG